LVIGGVQRAQRAAASDLARDARQQQRPSRRRVVTGQVLQFFLEVLKA